MPVASAYVNRDQHTRHVGPYIERPGVRVSFAHKLPETASPNKKITDPDRAAHPTEGSTFQSALANASPKYGADGQHARLSFSAVRAVAARGLRLARFTHATNRISRLRPQDVERRRKLRAHDLLRYFPSRRDILPAPWDENLCVWGTGNRWKAWCSRDAEEKERKCEAGL